MKNLSKAFKQKLLRDERDYLVFASITLEDDTVLELTNSEIWANGFSYEEAVSSDDNFNALGSAIIGSATLIINNIYETYSPYDFTNARVSVEIGMYVINEEAEDEDDEEILEKFNIGIYTVDETSYNGGTIRLSLLDDMEQFDRPYVTSLVYPATLSQIVNEACTSCGVPLNTPEFPHRTYIVQSPPEDSTTFREVLSWAATIAGCFVKCNPLGELEFKWFDSSALNGAFSDFTDGGSFNPWSDDTSIDGGSFNPWSTGDVIDGGTFYEERSVHHITGLFSQTISMDDVVITGVDVSVKVETENATQDVVTAHAGSSGYIIAIENNPFITVDTAQDIANWLGTQIIGLRFRKLSVSIGNDPSIESGDVAIILDRKQNIYRALVTRTSFAISNTQTIVCGAATPSRNNATRFSSQTKSYVETRKLLRQETSARQLAFQELAGRINNSAGLYTTMVTPQTGGTIYYMHDKPLLSDSKNVWKMTAEVWSVTDDWQGTDAATTQADKWNLGMIVNGDVIARILTATGINADWINTGAITVQDASGNVTFQADVDTGNVTIKATDIPKQYFGSGTPTSSNYPENQWTTNTLKYYHVGDLYTDTATKKVYQYKGGYVGTKIKFSSDCETEDINNDYVRIYFYDYNAGKYYAYPAVGGTGSTNTIAGAEFFIPTKYYYIYWRTNDSDQNYYGWKIESSEASGYPEFPTQATEVSVPEYTTTESSQTTTPESAHFPYETNRKRIIEVNTGNPASVKSRSSDSEISNPTYRWEEIVGAEVDPQDVLDEMTQQQIFNKLTNNGQAQGIYLDNGQLYILFTYAKGGTLNLGGASNTNGVLVLKNSNNNEIGRWDNTGFYYGTPGMSGSFAIYPNGTTVSTIPGVNIRSGDKILITNGGSIYADSMVLSGNPNSTSNSSVIMNTNSNNPSIYMRPSSSLPASASRFITKYGMSDPIMSSGTGLEIYGHNIVRLCNSDAEYLDVTDGGTVVNGYFRLQGNCKINGNLDVSGTDKFRVIDTKNNDTVSMAAYETATPYFGDIGTGIVGEDGISIIAIDDVFSDTINFNIEYLVFLQKEGPGDIWISEKDTTYFVVTGTPGLKFAWEIKAVQSGHVDTRPEDYHARRASEVIDERVGLSLVDDLVALDNEKLFDDIDMEGELYENTQSISSN